jgi:hypothetical protein
MARAARKVGVRRLSDFSRTAVYLGLRAEKQGQPARADRAYKAALLLDDSDPDAILARLSFLVRRGKVGEALGSLPESVAAMCSVHETRIALLSSLGIWTAAAGAATLAGLILSLAVRHAPRVLHDIREAAFRFGRSGAPPLASWTGFPPFIHSTPVAHPHWGALLWATPRAAAHRSHRRIRRSRLPAPLALDHAGKHPPEVAAAHRRDDPRAARGRQRRGRPAPAAAVFPEDPDVCFSSASTPSCLGDMERVQSDYGRDAGRSG